MLKESRMPLCFSSQFLLTYTNYSNNGFHYDIFMHKYNLFWSFSCPYYPLIWSSSVDYSYWKFCIRYSKHSEIQHISKWKDWFSKNIFKWQTYSQHFKCKSESTKFKIFIQGLIFSMSQFFKTYQSH
jgi:hypothetical protein